jgi:hypothetical protein
MKVKVTTGFSDKTKNKKFRPIGTILDVDDKRAEELVKAQVAEKVAEPAPASETKK